uniref:Uncharacterized protein n=1 Tax=Ditylenchus dipsaci TaxID=166011 RepID=A0A915DCK9_9BILA
MQEHEVGHLFDTVNTQYFDYTNRLHTFNGKWKYDKVKGANCTSKNLAKQHEMLWDPEDQPSVEHHKHRPDCELAKLNKPEEQFVVKDWLRVISYVKATQQYPCIAESTESLSALMDKLVTNTEKFSALNFVKLFVNFVIRLKLENNTTKP